MARKLSIIDSILFGIRLIFWGDTELPERPAIKFTGDFAAEGDPKRWNEVKAYVDRHEESADQATTAVFLLGLAAGVAVYLGRGERPLPTWMLALLMVVGIGASVMYARSANLGGRINHPELR